MTLRAAVLGHPISHSKSPALHLAAYGKLGIDIAYTAVDLTAQALPDFMREVRTQAGWRGLSVTMPLKTAMMSEVDEVRGIGHILGVVNTVAFETAAFENDAGTTVRGIGYNTDVAGIVNAVRYAGVASAPAAVILGGGGTSAAAVAALKDLEAKSVQVFVRDTGRAVEARAAAAGVGLEIDVRPLSEAASSTASADVVISTLPPRAADNLADELAAIPTLGGGVLLDVAYDPWPSRIASVWQAGGGSVVPGLEMLLYQAVEQVRLFSRLDEEVNAAVIDVMCDAVGLPRRAF